MKQKRPYRRRTKGGGLIDTWPDGCLPPDQLAERVVYAGSSEHKGRPAHSSFDCEPELRADASQCSPDISRERAQQVLRESVRRRCVGRDFDGGFPRYAWGWLGGQPYAARLTNRERGAYEGWPVEEIELPVDREDRLARDAWEVDPDV